MQHLQLLVGLGNPGSRYEKTRHNVGQWFIQRLAEVHRLSFQTHTRLQAQVSLWPAAEGDLRLCLPTTYMNESGQAVQKLSAYFKIPPEAILVIHDELDLEPGIVRLKVAGGHGGHNGLRSLIAHLGSNAFIRLRLGIGHPGHRAQVTNYVLEAPSMSDKKAIDEAIEQSLCVLTPILAGQFELAMNRLHRAP